jgi:hypothetical protein
MSNEETHDWDDNMDYGERAAAMNYTRARMGLPLRDPKGRNEHFSDGAATALYSGITAGGGYSEARRIAKYGPHK